MLLYRSNNWLRVLLASRGSFSPGVPWRVLAFGVVGVGVYFSDQAGHRVRLPFAMYEVAGAVLALVLAFRANTGYQRFWEGRGLWGSIVNNTRNIARIAKVYARKEPEIAREIAVWCVMFAHASRLGLRSEPVLPDATRLLSAADAQTLAQSSHPALYAASQLSDRVTKLLEKGAIDVRIAQLVEEKISGLVNDLGGSEKILKTPTPLGLVVLMQRFIALFLATFPFSVVGRVGLLTPLVTMAVAYPLLMVDALGGELDYPFGHHPNDLPLSRICSTIEHNLITDGYDADDNNGMLVH